MYKKVFLILICSFIASFIMPLREAEGLSLITKECRGRVVEIGTYARFNTNGLGKEACIKWLKQMNLYNSKRSSYTQGKYDEFELLTTPNDIDNYSSSGNESVINNVTQNTDSSYCVQFGEKNIYGYIESKGANIIIFIREMFPKENSEQLENRIRKSMGIQAKSTYFSKYLKIKSSIKDVKDVKSIVLSYLINQGFRNINCSKISNGFTGTAVKLIYNKKSKLNLAILKGDKANYIILGTPIIDISY